ncbi:MAG: hypothetical protein GF334_09010 [Candidatus Altiarchaeales archaeon]|nr:hypothetical protein [Candidatus Altiarchaeales archaeon]
MAARAQGDQAGKGLGFALIVEIPDFVAFHRPLRALPSADLADVARFAVAGLAEVVPLLFWQFAAEVGVPNGAWD